MYYNHDNERESRSPIYTDDFTAEGMASARTAPKKKKHTGVKIAALCLVCALVGGAAGGFAVSRFPGAAAQTEEPAVQEEGALPAAAVEGTVIYEAPTPAAVTVANVSADHTLSMSQIYAANVGSTVGITTELVTTNYWRQRVKGAAAGSGFVISADGYILTNYHVIDGATSIEVAFNDGTTYPATLVGGEEQNDIAVLKIEATGLTPVVLGNSDALVVGEQVCAIGNPLGELTFTFTAGYVSAKDRSITMSDGTVMNMLQTDTAINAGNSGGPLFNSYGQVIGITTAKYSSSSSSEASIEGIGFAIPINDVKDMVKDIMEKGYVTGTPNVGILMDDVSAQAQRYGIPAGAYIEAVLEGSCADRAGLRYGDIVTAVGDTTVSSTAQLSSAVKNYRAGDAVTFTVYRDGETLTLTLVLDEWTTQREAEMSKLQESYQQTQQGQQSQEGYGYGDSGSGYGGYGWGWPFGWGW